MRGRVAVVVKGYPRLSETFIAEEILGLEQRGLELLIVSLRHPTDRLRHAVHTEIKSPVLYLPEYVYQEPRRVMRAVGRGMRRAAFWRVLGLWFRDLVRDPTPNRARRWAQALVLADELPADIVWIYAHYIHTPSSVARYAAHLRGLPYSISAHAKDIWITPVWEKREKMAEARWIITCSRTFEQHLRGLLPSASLECVYHGINPQRLPPPPIRPPGRPEAALTVLTVARAVEKKGLDILLEALATLAPRLDWRLVHIGGGDLIPRLQHQAEALGIAGRIDWRGPADHAAVLEAMRGADLFCLPARVATDGDRDGLPNVILEALSQQLAVVATTTGAIPEIIEHERTGLLVPENDAGALAEAMAWLAADPALRHRLGEAGRKRVERDFVASRAADRIAELLGAGGRRAAA